MSSESSPTSAAEPHAPLLRSRQGSSDAPRTPTLALLLGRAVGRRGPSMLMRETAARELEERRADWGYSRPVVVLDVTWNMAFVLVSVVMLLLTTNEKPNTPIRVWICGYAAQCLVHVVLVWLEYRRRTRRASRMRRAQDGDIEARNTDDINDSEDEEAGDGSSLNSSRAGWAVLLVLPLQFFLLISGATILLSLELKFSRKFTMLSFVALLLASFGNSLGKRTQIPRFMKRCESVNTLVSFLWWIVGFYWVISGGDTLLQDAPRLYWLAVVFLAFDVFFAVFCVVLACLIGIALCCCLPCIIAILYAVAGQEGASEADLSLLPKYRFRMLNNEEKPTGGAGSMVPLETSSGYLANERILLPEDAECCICLTSYEDGAELNALPCNHHFHSTCIVKWLKMNATCPLCKYNILKGNEQV